MDGLQALPLLLAKAPKVTVIVISTLTQRNAQVSLKVPLDGCDRLPSPSPESHRGVTTSATFRQELVARVQALAVRHQRRSGGAPAAPSPTLRPVSGAGIGLRAPAAAPLRPLLPLRPRSDGRPDPPGARRRAGAHGDDPASSCGRAPA